MFVKNDSEFTCVNCLKKVEKSVVTLNKMLLNHLKMNTNLNSINKIA